METFIMCLGVLASVAIGFLYIGRIFELAKEPSPGNPVPERTTHNLYSSSPRGRRFRKGI